MKSMCFGYVNSTDYVNSGLCRHQHSVLNEAAVNADI